MTTVAQRAARLAALLVAGAAAAPAHAQISLTFVGTPATLRVTSASAGQSPLSAVVNGSSWSLAGVWAVHPRIVAQLQSALPAGVQLEVNVSAPSGATSAGWVVLSSTTAKDVVTNLPLVAIGGLSVSYRLTATAAAGVVALTSRAVVFTVLWT